MECRRAFEIDLGEFLRHPRDPAWADFRAHYPRCAGCAAEVRAHTEVALLLAPDHPDPERLLRLEDASASLDAGERAMLEAHVAGCVTCRDELAALRRPVPVTRRATVTPLAASARRRWLPSVGRWLWQPGVAWAAVLMLALYSTLGPSAREQTATDVAKQRIAPEPMLADEPAPAVPPPSVNGEVARDRPAAAPAERGLGGALVGLESRARHAARAEPKAAAPRALLSPHATTAGAAVLDLTLPGAPAEVDVEVRAVDGRRHLTQRTTASATGAVTLTLSADWLETGPHDVLVRDPSGRVLYATRVESHR
jgi:hypothetical protein